jgi:cell wall-associated NlpC family hydrolase
VSQFALLLARISARTRARTLLLVSCAALIAVGGLPAPVAADGAPTPTQASQIIQIGEDHLGARWAFAASGPNQFDCSGFVTFAFRQAGLIDKIGGTRRTVAGYRKWFKDQGLADLDNPQPGDLIVWGRDQHIGIYVGDGMAISALINPYGVTLHSVTGYIHMKPTAYLHVDITR